MQKIVSVSLDKTAAKIYNRINKIRNYGWFSKDVQQMLEKKYGNEKKELVAELNELQKKRDDIELEIKALARKINSIKDENPK